MNIIDFNQVGGFPLSTKVLDDLQKAFSIFNALGAIAGDKTIISGCQTVGNNVSNGFVYAFNEVFEFRGGTAQTKVKIVEVVEDLVFEVNVSKPVIKTRYITFGTGVGAMNWVDFKRGFETKGIEAVLSAINTTLSTIATKLATVETGAQVQLQSDFNQIDATKKDFIKNKPDFVNYLHKDVFDVGDNNGTDSLKIVTFPDVGTNNYMVVGCMLSNSSDYNTDNDVIWMIREKANTSFKLTLREVSAITQNLIFEYMLIPL